MKVKRKTIIIVLAAGFSVAAVSTVWLAARQPSVPDFSDKKLDEIADYLRSDEFREMDRGTRRASIREAMGQMMASRAKEYCELPAQEQTAYLDEVIDSMQTRRREIEGRREDYESRRREFEARREQTQARSDAQDGGQRRRWQGRRRGRRRSAERMRLRTEFIDPKVRAQRAKFREALRERMRERGISFRPPRR
jgi:hypothetical protein